MLEAIASAMEEIGENIFRYKSASQKILYLLKTHGEMSSKEISDTFNMKKKNVDSLVSRLAQKVEKHIQ